jgi:carbohydrate diacid regulator
VRPFEPPAPVDDLVRRVAEVLSAPVVAVDMAGLVLARAGGDSPAPLLHGQHIRFQVSGQAGELVVQPPSDFDGVPQRLLESVVELVTGQISAMESLSRQRELKDRFIWRLLHGDIDDDEDALREGQILGMDLSRPRAVMLIDVASFVLAGPPRDGPAPEHWLRAQGVIKSIVSFFSLPTEAICAYIGEGEIAVLKASSSTDLSPWARTRVDDMPASWANLSALKQAGEELLGRLKRDADDRTSIGIGRYHRGIRGLARSYEDARAALNIGCGLTGPGRLYCLDQLGMAALVGIRDEATKSGLARHLIGPLEVEPDLLHTLEVYFANNCSVVATSNTLYVHRNTLNYRLEKVASLTGIDPRRFDGAMLLHFALLLCHLADEGLYNCPITASSHTELLDKRPMHPSLSPA